ncbi:MAG: Fibronectin type domain protein, partial [Myxococcaceae bacterium]|nr:Fibronectin type domain protein [Myxococcaceae bacterium]
CVGGCDPAAGCRTTAGLCADRCDANLLRTMRACQGCGAAGSSGLCGGGAEFACDAGSHSLCRAVSCGGQAWLCTNDGGTWQWRTGTRCDDGNACTHSDACTAGACGGTAVTCASDVCATRACAGTATCAVTPHPGAACDDGNAMTNRDLCSAAGACVGVAFCALPADACADGTQNRDRCTGARVIGRRSASSAAGFTIASDTCSASNRFDDCDWDAGADHSYRLWVRAGEMVSAAVTRGDGCVNSSWDATLKLYQGGDCGTVTCSGDRWCRHHVNSTAQTYVAPRDGWIVVVVDGSTAFDDEGDYTLRVRLSGCGAAGCECP